jgi:hypothetical protein
VTPCHAPEPFSSSRSRSSSPPPLPAAAAGHPQPRIINGDDAAAGQYPWTVALVAPTGSADKRAFCGGTLIAPTVVLTAAHCTIGSRTDQIDVVAGDHDLSAVDADNTFDVTKISLHPLAEGDDDDLIPRRDVSLLTLDGNATAAGADGQFIAVGDATDITATTEFDVSGWGLTESSIDTVDLLQFATVDKVDDVECQSIFDDLLGQLSFSDEDQICAIRDPDGDPDTPDDVIDTCNGDSGGPLAKAGASTSSATGWELIGVTSWGLDCAFTFVDPPNPNLVVPGVYARAADVQLRPYVDPATGPTGADPAAAQPQLVSGTPQVDADEDLVVCLGNPLTWSGAPDQVEQLIRRVVAPGEFETVSWTGLYTFDEGDFGDQFVCEVHARATGAGGYGVARSAAVQVADAPVVEPTVVTVTTPVATPVPVPVPSPPQLVPVIQPDARDADDRDPRVRSVRRSCTKRRICTFTVTASDAGGSGVKTLAAAVNTVRTRSCRRGGRRTTCASWRSASLRPRAVRDENGTFRLTTRRLSRGTHVLHVRAVDRAGNVQERPRRVTFRLR